MKGFFFFFSSRRRHTRLTCDWSSDVCSSDLRRKFGLRGIVEQAPDFGGHGVEAGGDRQNRRRAEQRHRLQEGDDRAGKQRRQRQRNRDAPRRRPGASAENGGGVLE